MLAATRHESARPTGVSFKDLREGLYKFPLGAIDEAAMRFCGAEAAPGSPWRWRIAYVLSSRR